LLSSEGYKIYRTYLDGFLSIKNIFGGVLSIGKSQDYDTLTNITVVCKEQSTMTPQALEKFYKQLDDLISIVCEYDDLNRQENGY
jgi:hypothetical protein